MIFNLFIRFLLIGTFTIGGGLATIPHLIELSQVTGWFSESFLMTMIAISESTPGPIGINMATVVGVRVAGVFGGLVASIGVSLAGIILMLIIAPSLSKYRNNRIVVRILKGLKPTMIALILSSAFLLWSRTVMDLFFHPILVGYGIVMVIALSALLVKFQLKSYQIILISALCGWGLSFIL
jgi:chromate transporter